MSFEDWETNFRNTQAGRQYFRLLSDYSRDSTNLPLSPHHAFSHMLLQNEVEKTAYCSLATSVLIMIGIALKQTWMIELGIAGTAGPLLGAAAVITRGQRCNKLGEPEAYITPRQALRRMRRGMLIGSVAVAAAFELATAAITHNVPHGVWADVAKPVSAPRVG